VTLALCCQKTPGQALEIWSVSAWLEESKTKVMAVEHDEPVRTRHSLQWMLGMACMRRTSRLRTEGEAVLAEATY